MKFTFEQAKARLLEVGFAPIENYEPEE